MNHFGGDTLLFYTFSSQEERKEFGGSYFIELQYCRLAQRAEIEEIVSLDSIELWKDDSLYIYADDDNEFMSHYGDIFTGGIYSDGKSGMVDILGINYYSRELTHFIAAKVMDTKPFDYQVLLPWLEKAKEYNGFYILGY